ncbi:MAG: lipocalin family protein [Victivallales bacterium]|nr:lipocalin family protein [Victivallales bacterium]
MKRHICMGLLFLAGCGGIPEGVEPVGNFELDRYLGKWYEVARLDHSFERGLSRVTADYSMRDDGGVRVFNRGFSESTGEWKQAEGKAYFARGSEEGYLKVSFFGPFYGKYIIFGLDHGDYRHALVCGPSKSYLWILSRIPALDKQILDELLEKASAAGFNTSKLIFVKHE